MRKVTVINPRGIKGDEEYTHGVCEFIGRQKDFEVTLYTNYYYPFQNGISYKVNNFIFRKSEKMKNIYLRKIVRLIEYLTDWLFLMKKIKKENTDVIHIMWPVIYKIDLFFISRLKRRGFRIIYTAHNVLPHSSGEKYKKDFGKLYHLMDAIIVNGKNIYAEFEKYFSEESSKVIISRHGCKKRPNIVIKNNEEYDLIFEKYEKVFLVFGILFYEKGIDRIVKIWENIHSHNHTLLVIAGRQRGEYKELTLLKDKMVLSNDILYYDDFVPDQLLSYFLFKSTLVLLPYRHASMSGVLFSAASYNKPVFATDTGSLSEYIQNKENGFIVKNDDKDIEVVLNDILMNYSEEMLRDMGIRFGTYIDKEYAWEKIVDNYISIYI